MVLFQQLSKVFALSSDFRQCVVRMCRQADVLWQVLFFYPDFLQCVTRICRYGARCLGRSSCETFYADAGPNTTYQYQTYNEALPPAQLSPLPSRILHFSHHCGWSNSLSTVSSSSGGSLSPGREGRLLRFKTECSCIVQQTCRDLKPLPYLGTSTHYADLEYLEPYKTCLAARQTSSWCSIVIFRWRCKTSVVAVNWDPLPLPFATAATVNCTLARNSSIWQHMARFRAARLSKGRW